MIFPKVSVVMPVYNGEKHLSQAIDSVLQQTFADFELIIVNDGSTDGTAKILSDYADKDPRVIILTNGSNINIAHSLNRGIAAARGKYIARMDADDISLPERLEKQVEFMEKHPEVVICGSWFGVLGSKKTMSWPVDNDGIRSALLFRNALGHSTILFRKDRIRSFVGLYNVDMPPAEDYELWTRLSENDETVFSALPEVLVLYRLYPDDEREKYLQAQFKKAGIARKKLLSYLGLFPTVEELECHEAISALLAPSLIKERVAQRPLFEYLRWLYKLQRANSRKKYCSQSALKRLCTQLFLRIVVRKLLNNIRSGAK